MLGDRPPGAANTGTPALQVEVAVFSTGNGYRPTHLMSDGRWLRLLDCMQVGDVHGCIHVWWVRLPGQSRFSTLEADVGRDGSLTWWLLVDEADS